MYAIRYVRPGVYRIAAKQEMEMDDDTKLPRFAIRVYGEDDNLLWRGWFDDFRRENDDADEDWSEVRRRLRKGGYYYMGGGSAPMVKLVA